MTAPNFIPQPSPDGGIEHGDRGIPRPGRRAAARRPVVPREAPARRELRAAQSDTLLARRRGDLLHAAHVEAMCTQLAGGGALILLALAAWAQWPGSLVLWVAAGGCAMVWWRDVRRWRSCAREAAAIERARRAAAGEPQHDVHPALRPLADHVNRDDEHHQGGLP